MATLNQFHRLKLLCYILSASFLAGILLSLELWFPSSRSFPRIPLLIALPEAVVVLVERLLGAILITALILMAVVHRSKIFSVIAVASLILLICFDQMRLQPWVYQYLLLLSMLTLHNWQTKDEATLNHTLGHLQLIVAALYIWSGVQKLNFSFSHEMLPELLAPLHRILPAEHLPLVTLGLGIAVVETLIGCGLLFPRTRKLCVWLAVAMHGIILGLLIARAYNSIVWAWNVALMLMVVVVFWCREDASRQTLNNWKTSKTTTQLARAVAVASVVLPILSFWGWWDMSMSGALYSGNTAVAVVRINGETFTKLPQTAQRQVFQTKSDGRQMLPLFEWSMAELNVPPNPEPRVFRQLTRQVCKLTADKSAVELVMKERPAMLDGSYQVTRISCAQLER